MKYLNYYQKHNANAGVKEVWMMGRKLEKILKMFLNVRQRMVNLKTGNGKLKHAN